MGEINVLDKSLVEKIAAGEVIERPSSVVKELIENSLDAGATSIIIEVELAGNSFIRVTDNGKGMDSEDLMLCFFQHATSKIKDIDDLFKVGTLGFRGEALSSISAVSFLEISSRQKGNLTGNSILVKDGNILDKKEKGIPEGTTVIVRDLFYNTPVRKKHLKSDKIEISHIIDIVERYSLSDKGLSFQLFSDKKEILNVPSSDDMMNKIVMLYGKDTAKHMLYVDYKDDFCSVKGYIGKPYLARKDRKQQTLFVNGRYIKSTTITNALYDAYHTLLFLDRHPACILFFEIDVGLTDVNVHPTKEIIRIEKEDLLYQSIFDSVRKVFLKKDITPEINLPEPMILNEKNLSNTKRYNLEKEKQQLLVNENNLSINKSDLSKNLDNYNEKITGKICIGPVKILGQINFLYIVAENSEGILIIDQHAAQERVYFERFLDQFIKKDIPQQRLIRPKIVEVTHREDGIIKHNIGILKKMGIGIEEYGTNTYRVDVVPQIFGFFSDELMLDIIHEIESKDSKSLEETVEERIAMKACKLAIKAGDPLTEPQMIKLVEDLEKCINPFSCPHGRPTIIKITISELEKKFKRKL